SGQPIVFSHGWPLSADDWDAQMTFFLGRGYRVIAAPGRRRWPTATTWTATPTCSHGLTRAAVVPPAGRAANPPATDTSGSSRSLLSLTIFANDRVRCINSAQISLSQYEGTPHAEYVSRWCRPVRWPGRQWLCLVPGARLRHGGMEGEG